MGIVSLVIFLFICFFPSLTQHQQSDCRLPTQLNTFNTIYLGTCSNNMHLLNLMMGTPYQEAWVGLDLGAQFTWVEGQQINDNGFNATESETLIRTKIGTTGYFSLNEKNYGYQGQFVNDIVHFNTTTIKSSNQFQIVDKFSDNSTLEQLQGSGMLALGFYDASNIFDSAYQQSQISGSSFAFNLHPYESQISSTIFFGSLPYHIESQTITVPITVEDYYGVLLLASYIDDQQIDIGSCETAILRNSDNLIRLNTNIYQSMQPYFSSCTTINNTICQNCQSNNYPTLSLMLQGSLVYIPSSMYFSSNCTLLLVQSSSNSLILGLPFFYKYNITFDKDQQTVGFQGHTLRVDVIGQDWQAYVSYSLIMIVFLLILFGVYLLWEIRIIKKPKISRFAEISLTNGFLSQK